MQKNDITKIAKNSFDAAVLAQHRQSCDDMMQQIAALRLKPQLQLACLAHRKRSNFCDLRLRCPSQTPEIARFPRQETAMMHCDLRVRWKVASDLRFRAAISEPKTPSFCGISGDLALSTRKSLAIAIVRFWCAEEQNCILRIVPPLRRNPIFSSALEA